MTAEEEVQRVVECRQVQIETEKLKGVTQPRETTEMTIQELYERPFTLEEYRDAAKILAGMKTYNRLTWEHWKEALNPKEVPRERAADMARAAYEQGRIDERESQPPTKRPEEVASAIRQYTQQLGETTDLREQLIKEQDKLRQTEMKMRDLQKQLDGAVEENRQLQALVDQLRTQRHAS